MMEYRLECVSLKDGKPIPMPSKTVLCLGNFDGVHYAHRTLLSSAVAWRNEVFPDAAVGVFCFRELPAKYLESSFVGKLCTTEERLERFCECGLEFAILAEFSELCDFSAETYMQQVLMEDCNAVAVACGYNHRFGKRGAGSVSLLQSCFGENVLVQTPVMLDGKTVSSSKIRELLQNGKPREAARLLTQPYSISAPVLHGKALGSRMGTPTVNQRFSIDSVIPMRGVYVTECDVDSKTYRGITNVGIRPTVELDGAVNCETYLLDFSGDLYGKILTVRFLEFIREEKKFEDADALWRQIAKDVKTAREFC